jgi:hypothetical protein
MIKTFTALLIATIGFANTHTNDVGSRLQWMHNSGYCGEVSLIAASLYYGQYISQYDVRALVSKDQTGGSLLLGVNDAEAAEKLHLKYEEWNTEAQENTDQFLVWMKQNVVNGYPVAIGVYANQTLFETGFQGDPDYDHIVSVSTLTSSHPLNDPTYYGTDQVGFSDNGLWENQNTPVYFFNYSFDPFQASRKDANAATAAVYSLPICTLNNNVVNYGIAIQGVADLNGDTLPVRIQTDYNFEDPSIGRQSNKRPLPMPLNLTVTVSNLEPLVPYNLYLYNNLESVPESDFNAHASQAYKKRSFEIRDGSTYTIVDPIQSDEIAVYRCVKASAP